MGTSAADETPYSCQNLGLVVSINIFLEEERWDLPSQGEVEALALEASEHEKMSRRDKEI
jgi:hypothetical protein